MKIPEWGKRVLPVLSGVALHALTWLLLLSIAGAAFIVNGVYLMLGAGPAYLVAGACLILAASQVKKGMTRG